MRSKREQIEAELYRLEAERERRIDEKVEQGKAVRTVDIRSSEDDNQGLIQTVDAEGREGVVDLSVFTGVPRGDVTEQSEGSESAGHESHFPTRYESPSTFTPRAHDAVFEEPPAPRIVRIQIEGPTEDSMGAVDDFRYTVARDGTLTVSDRRGVVIGSATVIPGDDLDAAARLVVLKQTRSAFWRRLS